MPGGDCFHLLDTLRSDEASSLREGFEAALESESHAFEQTSMDDIGERMAIQNSMKVWSERHSASDLSQASEKYFGARHIRVRGQVLWVARIANDCVGGDTA